jgi:transcriptional regulator with XRE-family HTH domain
VAAACHACGDNERSHSGEQRPLLIRETRLRKGLSQRRLALRAGTSQSAIARIERGEEEVTWSRLRALMVSMGEEPVLTSEPLPRRYHAADLLRDHRSTAEVRLRNGLELNEFATELALAGHRAKHGRGQS